MMPKRDPYWLAILRHDEADVKRQIAQAASHAALAAGHLGRAFKDLGRAMEKLDPEPDTVEAGDYKIHLVEQGWVTPHGTVLDGAPVQAGNEVWMSWNDYEAEIGD